MRISDWSSDVCSSDLELEHADRQRAEVFAQQRFARGDVESREAQLQVAPGDAPPPAQQRTQQRAQWRAQRALPRPWQPCEIGRASCRERVCQYGYITVVAVSLKKKKPLRNTTLT